MKDQLHSAVKGTRQCRFYDEFLAKINTRDIYIIDQNQCVNSLAVLL